MPDNMDTHRSGGWSVPGYRHVRELGSGATGVVVHAVEEETGTPVAIKYLSARLLADAEVVDRFRAEARLLENLSTPHVARLFEYVQSSEGAAIVMELVKGVSLHALLRERGATEPEAALTLLKGSLLGLSAAHGAGVVHRDYKPANVLVDEAGCSKLVDFGIAVRQGDEARAEGTPAYMAPEQWRGEPASPATDVYAATATFFECLTGSKPYTGSTLPELAMQHVTAPVPEERAPEKLRDLIRRGMAKSPQERPATADEFIGELEAAALEAYGEEWEERGRRRLVLAVAGLLPLLWPAITQLTPPDGADAATTVLPQTGSSRGFRLGGSRLGTWACATAGAAVLALGAAFTVAAVSGDEAGHSPGAAPTSGTSVSDDASPSASASPSDSASASASPSDSASPSASGSSEPSASSSTSGTSGTSGTTGGSGSEGAPGDGGDPDTPAPGGGPTAEPPSSGGAGGADPEPEAPAVQVKFLAVSGMAQGKGQTASASLAVSTDTTARVTLTVRWYDANADSGPGNPGSLDGASESFTLEGQTEYKLAVRHTFDSSVCTSYWGVLGSTDPGAEQSRPYQKIQAPSCVILF